MMCVAAGVGGVCAGGSGDGSVSVFDAGSETMTARFDEANVWCTSQKKATTKTSYKI